MNSDERTTARGLARYARDFYAAAIAADNALGSEPGYEVVAPVPVMFLVAHSIELILKAYLCHSGLTVEEIKKLNHNLKKNWQAASECGIEKHVLLNETDREVLSLISQLHVSTELRYIQTGYKTFPVFGPLQKLTEKLLDALCPLVGYR